jgi:cytochrome c oxidase cbb3-type subunit 3
VNIQTVAYSLFTVVLAAIFAGIIFYYYNPGRKKEVEEPKYRMLRDEEPERPAVQRRHRIEKVWRSPFMSDRDLPLDADNRIPGISLLLFAGVIVFLFWYIASFTPAISGWSYYTRFEKERIASSRAATTANPGKYLGNPMAIAEGRSAFESNCAACHKSDASGGIGPNLKGTLMYGSTPDKLFESISKGRPKGMPSFGQTLGNDRIDRIIAFLESIRP